MAILIKKMIAHKLNIENALPILSDKCIDLNGENITLALPFFEKHIMNTRKQSSMKNCQFLQIDDNSIRKSMTRIMDSIGEEDFEQVFIEESKKNTLRLAELIRKSSSTSDGSLFIILYEYEGFHHIGFLKMDPNDGVQVNDDLTISVQKDMLPSINEKLHKSALIVLKEYKKNEVHLMVLDKQQGTNEPAQFFLNQFLNAIELASDRNITRFMQSQLASNFNQIIGVDNAPILDGRLRKTFLDKSEKDEEFDLDIDLEHIIRPLLKPSFSKLDLTESINDFKEEVLKVYPDANFSFKPDSDVVKEIIFRNRERSVELRFSPELEIDEDYSIKHEDNGDTLITLRNGIGEELEEIIPRRR
ncbi:nucleoid-associated protein [Enterococcus gilvus]|uniref:nucleoid-associated protein n=1 Tax=Enterococcus gilvus TaxID=160453 RepID=UPI00345EB6BA